MIITKDNAASSVGAALNTLKDLLTTLAQAELEIRDALAYANALNSEGVLTSNQAIFFNAIADNLFQTEKNLYRVLLNAVPTYVPDFVLSRIPAPEKLPTIVVGSPLSLPQGSGTNGLGLVPLVIAGVAIPAWALIVLGLLAATVLVAIVVGGAYLAANLVGRVAADLINAQNYKVYLANYWNLYASCRNQGGSPVDCRALVQQSAPVNALPQPALAEGDLLTGWKPYLVGGGVLLGGFLIWNIFKTATGSSGSTINLISPRTR